MDTKAERYESMGLKSGARALQALDELLVLAPLLTAIAKGANPNDREVLERVAAIIRRAAPG